MYIKDFIKRIDICPNHELVTELDAECCSACTYCKENIIKDKFAKHELRCLVEKIKQDIINKGR